jgi:hypothetical protein
MTYKTTSLQEAAALMSQTIFKVEYIEPSPTKDPSRFEFVFEVEAGEAIFTQWSRDYMHRRTSVEPKTYDASLNVLRDTLNHQKSFKRGN